MSVDLHAIPSSLDEDLQPIRALNDLLFCERRCAMHRIENVWVENASTLEGTNAHQRADRAVQWEMAPGVRAVHGLMIRCQRLRLVGKADIVEFRRQSDGSEELYPVEYKRGRRRKWDNDDVQLCAQALCLEEMLGVAVPAGAIFHVKSKRRREVPFTPPLRQKTEETAKRLHDLLAAGVTPLPVLKARCRGCSLKELCMPELLDQRRRVHDYHGGLFVARDT